MKTIVISRTGNPEVLTLREAPDPEPGPEEVCIEVSFSGVNFADILARKGLYPDGPRLPAVVGYEVSGIVKETGSRVGNFKAGDRVMALTRFNGYADRLAVPVDQVFHLPEQLTLEQAAALPVNYLTAWQLVEMGGLRKEDTLLIHNAGGGVGLAALDLARHIGARTIGTASASKHERLKERGLDLAVDYRQENWPEEVLQATGGKGVDLIFDPLGGSSWKQSYRLLRPTGRMGLFGVSQITESGLAGSLKFLSLVRKMPVFVPVQLMNQNKGVYGVNLGRLWSEKEKISRWAGSILQGVRQGWILPHIDAVFPFHEAAQAHLRIEERRNFGKVLLKAS